LPTPNQKSHRAQGLSKEARKPVNYGGKLTLRAALRCARFDLFAAAPTLSNLARDLPKELARQRDDVSRLEAAAPELAVDRSSQDGEGTRIACTGGFTEG
jgi:hypothetical protein